MERERERERVTDRALVCISVRLVGFKVFCFVSNLFLLLSNIVRSLFFARKWISLSIIAKLSKGHWRRRTHQILIKMLEMQRFQ